MNGTLAINLHCRNLTPCLNGDKSPKRVNCWIQYHQERFLAKMPPGSAAHPGANDGALAGSAALRFRLAGPADLNRCAELLPAGFRASAAVQRRLVEIWQDILASEARTFTIVEDLERPRPMNIEGFGISVFVRESFLKEFWTSPRPYLAAAFYERMLAGDDPMLTGAELAAINSTTGLNVLVLHFGLSNEDLSNPRTAQVLSVGSSAFFFFHAGYRIHVLMNEVYGPQPCAYMEQGGFRLLRDFHAACPAEFKNAPPERRPYLFALRREWVKPGAVHPLSHLFFAAPSRIGFSALERRVLEGALLNESDLQIAERLGMSVDSVKNAWRNIYARTEREVRNLMPPAHSDSGIRGQEKRRHILEYVHAHPEELRPVRRHGRSEQPRHAEKHSVGQNRHAYGIGYPREK